MAKPIEYLDGARIDFDESFDWYAQRSAGAAIGFASAVDDALGTILKDPGRFPQTHGGCTYWALKRYPFRIVFRNEPPKIGHRCYRSRQTSTRILARPDATQALTRRSTGAGFARRARSARPLAALALLRSSPVVPVGSHELLL
jgi:plasmid stabilization system protein ParE